MSSATAVRSGPPTTSKRDYGLVAANLFGKCAHIVSPVLKIGCQFSRGSLHGGDRPGLEQIHLPVYDGPLDILGLL